MYGYGYPGYGYYGYTNNWFWIIIVVLIIFFVLFWGNNSWNCHFSCIVLCERLSFADWNYKIQQA